MKLCGFDFVGEACPLKARQQALLSNGNAPTPSRMLEDPSTPCASPMEQVDISWQAAKTEPSGCTTGKRLVHWFKPTLRMATKCWVYKRECEQPNDASNLTTYRSHDNTMLASCGGDRSVFYWDVATAQPVKRFSGHSARVNAVAFNSESTILASGKSFTDTLVYKVKASGRFFRHNGSNMGFEVSAAHAHSDPGRGQGFHHLRPLSGFKHLCRLRGRPCPALRRSKRRNCR
jgi:hypothetical protein